jgi:uncharacterized protein (DUF58 family)
VTRANKDDLRRAIDWGSLAPLRIRSRLVAEGVYAGAHRSARRGAGIEFGGHREYVPGDDLRWLDRRSLLRHDHLLVRQFETETDRALRLVVDASRSMAYRGKRGQGAKLAYAALVAAALGRVALTSGDPVGLAYLGGGESTRNVPVSGGREAFERLVGSLEAATPGGDYRLDLASLDRIVGSLAKGARRGSLVVFLSDLIDLPPAAPERMASIASRGKGLVVVQVLDPDEADLPFEGTVRLRALEGDLVVETDVDAKREEYLAAMKGVQQRWDRVLVSRGGRLVLAKTNEDPVRVVRAIIEAAR